MLKCRARSVTARTCAVTRALRNARCEDTVRTPWHATGASMYVYVFVCVCVYASALQRPAVRWPISTKGRSGNANRSGALGSLGLFTRFTGNRARGAAHMCSRLGALAGSASGVAEGMTGMGGPPLM